MTPCPGAQNAFQLPPPEFSWTQTTVQAVPGLESMLCTRALAPASLALCLGCWVLTQGTGAIFLSLDSRTSLVWKTIFTVEHDCYKD